MRGAFKRPGPTSGRTDPSPLRRAATWTGRPAGLPLLAWVVALAALALFLASVGVSHACDHPPPPISHPEPGTPRESYCSTVQGVGVGWVCFAAPLLVLAAGIVVLRRATVATVALAVAISAAAVVNAAIVGNLRAIQLVPGINVQESGRVVRELPDARLGVDRRADRSPARTRCTRRSTMVCCADACSVGQPVGVATRDRKAALSSR